MGRYTRNPEPFREAPLRYERRCGAQDPLRLHRDHVGDQSTEFSFGPGPVAPHLNGQPPSEGGVYRPRAPRVDPPRNEYGVGMPRQHRRPSNEAKGYPGDQT
ncbi:hypothetical protein [Mycobacterium kiyosense]|uniref:Uncharacterized protein n=1 Tax=Mycobacterium kiyosense TaxID=2871094 RepID=A0A9P3UZF2_9MYCO|nr:hypothetical protein [Mycobacterium kiyosense]GLB83489.1 hypothetical protein SRL2020028_27450 [Mycobacterium kiyosense]GLB94306.1 hypothetical protein SRL2020226_10820 [Mycobacterium kiyosense]GLD32639.1 hypothetical protein Mkiyose1413_45220 [Mycobacterium kiyosense]GLD37214.1 hypothetical protein Mkiyose1595_34340 [Mycobacterium kiyosense]